MKLVFDISTLLCYSTPSIKFKIGRAIIMVQVVKA